MDVMVSTTYAVIPVGTELMELRKNDDGSILAKAERASGTWTVTTSRDPSFSQTATGREEAWMLMIDNGPSGTDHTTQLCAPVEAYANAEGG